MNRTTALLAALLLSPMVMTAHGADATAPAAPSSAVAAAAAPASAPVRAARRIALPVGAETLPAEWLEAVEPGLSRLAQAPLPTPAKRAPAGPAAR